jgi:hypothetical protein
VYKLVLANAKTIVILDDAQGLDPESILILGIQDGFRVTAPRASGMTCFSSAHGWDPETDANLSSRYLTAFEGRSAVNA